MMIGGKQLGGPRPGERHTDGYEMTKSDDFFLDLGLRTHVVATTVCAMGGVYTHSVSHAHFLCTSSLRDVQTRTRTAQRVRIVYVISPHLTLSDLMFHPPSLLFPPHGHFDTTFPSAPSSSSFTRPQSAGQAHLRTCAGEFGGRSHALDSMDQDW